MTVHGRFATACNRRGAWRVCWPRRPKVKSSLEPADSLQLMPDHANAAIQPTLQALRTVLSTLCAVLASLFALAGSAFAAIVDATPENYREALAKLQPGDTLRLAPGEYRRGLPVHRLVATREAPIIIRGPSQG